MKKSRPDWFLYIILLVAFILRLPGIIDGLPAVYNSTEHYLARTVLGMGAARTIDPGIYIYPTLYTYFLFILYGSLYLFGHLIGIFASQYDFAVQFLTDPSIFYFCSRVFNVILSLTTIILLYRFIKHQSNITTARVSAALMAISYYMIRFSHFATADTILIFFSTLSILYIYRLIDSETTKDYFYAGIFCGLAIATKYNAGFLVVGLLMVVFQNWRNHRIKLIPILGISIGSVILGFIATNPLLLVYPERFYHGWQLVSSQMYNAVSAYKGIPFIWEILQLLQDEMIMGGIFIVATGFFLFGKRGDHYPVLIIILLTYLFVGTWTKKGIDYLFAAYPAWIILSASFIDQLFSKYIHRKSYKFIIILIIFLPSLTGAVLQFIKYTNQDTRELATEWIIENIKTDQVVCYDNYHIDLGVFDVHRYLTYGVSADQLPDPIKQKIKGFSTHPRQVNFVPILGVNSSETEISNNAYEAELMRYKRRELDELIRSDTSYLITNSWFFDSYISITLQDYPPGVQNSIRDVQRFYQQLLHSYKPVIVFKPDFWRPGPEIRVYQLN